ncbi:MAG: 23S rRNA (cytidine1920-2'-O)/16S rRNA (cytidine1409-2'-O)-methyltransferase [Candidatus Methanomarinus sp.]|nr:MAG: 23S rRNA (cytidine1920-2'-O)/16S rRNA (cytidine1409-2'-O)-methyltransferase [ANME-2 cluster archaeon]KAF5425878.1 23S rRNA (cytidine1920-2'-O)/16S rRNA (cytidine1409-2'-O)-methyltransferase [ANME-2 cluster archaeon]
MRLDIALVEQRITATRSRAKRAITMGLVSVDGTIITKPSKQIGYHNKIMTMENIDVPEGYMKLKNIQNQSSLLHHDDMVLDLGSSAGGFLLYSCEIVDHVRGIEYSVEFIPQLQTIAATHTNITVIKGDVFTMPLQVMSNQDADVIMSDLTVEPEDAIIVLARVLPLLKPGGRILQVLKISKNTDQNVLINKIQALGFTIQHIIRPKKREIYVIAQHNINSEVVE